MYNNTRDIILESVERIENLIQTLDVKTVNDVNTLNNISAQVQHIKTAANNE